MQRAELLRRITTLPLAAEKLAVDMRSGAFRSVFRGQGIEFDEARMYQDGDDVRSIDRNVSARFGRPYVKLYREEREFTVCVLLDCSASMFAGSTGSLSRFEQAALVTALIGFSTERAGQRFGAIIFDNTCKKVYKPRQGRNHAMAIVSAALDRDAENADRGTALKDALGAARRILKRRSMILVVSDFLALLWEQEFPQLCAKHDVIAVRIHDPLDTDFPDSGLLPIEDPETGKTLTAASGFSAFRENWAAWNSGRAALWANVCRRAGSAALELSTAQDAALELSRFFKSRSL